MPRRDLTEMEIRELRVYATTGAGFGQPPAKYRDQIERLVGEVQQLREREASQRHLAGLEEQY